MYPIDRPGFDHFVVANIAVNEVRFYECVEQLESPSFRPEIALVVRAQLIGQVHAHLSVVIHEGFRYLVLFYSFVGHSSLNRCQLGAVKIRSYANQTFASKHKGRVSLVG